jgi:hypothetical protein
MPGVLYRCVFCESSHEVARRADGPVYLRCPATYQWAWYDVAAFDLGRPNGASTGRAAGRNQASGARASAGTAGARRRGRTKASGRRALVSSGAKRGAGRRTGRRTTPRASARKSGRGGRR